MKILLQIFVFIIPCLLIQQVLCLAASEKDNSQATNPIPGEKLSQKMERFRLPGSLGLNKKGEPEWINLEPGLDFGEFRLNENESKIIVLRIEPEDFEFVLGASSIDERQPRSLEKWAEEYGLLAAINASMYLPDKRTSTGYMRSGEHINQSRYGARLGAFFVASPKKPGLPNARIIDRDNPDWRSILEDYNIVVQNYRMTNAQRGILWSPGGPFYSISAIAQDGKGRILFLHSRTPVEAYSFVQHLLHLPLDVRTIMYVEGGAQAGLLINSDKLKRDITAPHAPSFLITGNIKSALPNIIGFKHADNNK